MGMDFDFVLLEFLGEDEPDASVPQQSEEMAEEEDMSSR